ncbi:MAG: PQQ-dependent sugar dehydrogenase [Bacteroidota bacterium]
MKKLLLLFVVTLCAFSSFAQLPFTQTTVFSGLNMPVAFAIAPNDGRFFVTLKAGQIMVYNSSGGSIGTFYNLADSVINNFERGLLGICFDPSYTTNHYVYAYYVHRWPNVSTGNQALRVIRFTDNNNVGTNPTVILNIPVSNSIPGNHVGGNVHFRNGDGKLYVSIGELATPSNAQLKTNPFGKILRINKDGTIPTDNPFYDDGNPSILNDDRIWEYGHRNPFDFCFGANDSLYISENGENTQDEMNLGRKGGNYGWQTCEGNLQYGNNNPCNTPGLINPLTVWTAPLNAVTGIIFYSSCMFPEYKNHVIVANNDVGEIWDVVMGNAPAYNTVTSKSLITDLTSSGGLTTLQVGADGSIYAMNGGYTTNGGIFKLSRTITPAITATGPTSYCTPGHVTLNATPTGFTYQWYKNNVAISGATSASYAATLTGTYKVMICNNNSNEIYVQRKVTPVATVTPSDTQNICTPNTVFFQANTGTGLLYQWKKSGAVIAGATNSNYTATTNGKYKVVVTGSTGCTKVSSQVVVYITACREEENNFSDNEIKIYPNPSSDAFSIELTQSVTLMRVLDMQGKMLYQLHDVNGQIQFGSELPAGIYLLELTDAIGERTINKLVKTD